MSGQAAKILNISGGSKDWREAALSNFPVFPFVIHGTLFASVEGLVQGIKFPENDPRRRESFLLWGKEAKKMGSDAENDFVWWQGKAIPYGSPEHHQIIAVAIEEKFIQNHGAMRALAATVGYELVHEVGPESPLTSLPKEVFCKILTDLRVKMFGS